jgi:hypothetical protein
MVGFNTEAIDEPASAWRPWRVVILLCDACGSTMRKGQFVHRRAPGLADFLNRFLQKPGYPELYDEATR